MSLLEVDNLRVRIDAPAGAIHAVEQVSFRLEEGETLALVGESGSGKSVTCLAILGLTPPRGVIETGEVWLDGVNLLALSPLELERMRGDRISLVFQDALAALDPLMPIGLQMSEVLEVHRGLARREALKRCAEALGELGIAEPEARLESYPHELSGGQRQRALIAMALLCEPRVLLADEPTSSLDVTLQAQVVHLLRRRQHEHGTAIVFVTHDLGLTAGFADRVHVMYAGRIVETATTTELFEMPLHPYTAALLASAPRLDRDPGEPLVSIPGTAPDLSEVIEGCAFRPRCAFAVRRCFTEVPPLAAESRQVENVRLVGGRRAACFETERVREAGGRELTR
jgi:oligopeptide transport system ATP-binding protein